MESFTQGVWRHLKLASRNAFKSKLFLFFFTLSIASALFALFSPAITGWKLVTALVAPFGVLAGQLNAEVKRLAP